MTFTEELWRSITPTYDAILAHPFLTGLADGTLHPDAFTYYLCQDALYLGRYARALATLAGRAHEAGEVAMFARHAAGAVDVERHLHGSLLPQLGVDPATLGTAERARAGHHFRTTSRHEWMFWDMGHRQERWPAIAS